MAKLDTVVIKITGDTKQINKTIDQLEKIGKVDRQNAKSFKKTSKEQGKALDFVKGKALALGGVLLGAFAIQAVIRDAVNTLKEFEKELSTLQSITGSTTKEMEFFSKAAKEVGVQTKTSAKEVVKAFTLIGSAQPELLKNSKALAEVTKQALILGKAAGIDATDAALALTGAMNQFGASAEDAAKFTDIFATSQQKGSSFIRDTSEALINAGAAASAAGLSFETTNAAIQALAKGAIVGARAGTALRGVLSKLSSQSDDKINPSMIGLGKTLRVLQSRNLDLAKATKLVGEEGATGLLTLIKQIDIFEELDGSLNDVGNAMEQMQINTDNLEGSIEELGNAYEDFILTLSESDGFLKGSTDLFTQFFESISGTEDEARKLGEQFGLNFKQVRRLTKEFGTYGGVVIELRSRLDKLNLEQTEFGVTVKTNLVTSLSTVEILERWQKQLDILSGKTEEETKVEKDRLKTIGELKKELTNLRKAQDALLPGSKELLINQTRVKEIQAILKNEVKKSITPFAQLTKRISDLKKELQDQALAGDISKETIKELNDAVDDLTTAEVELQIALSGTLPFIDAQKLALEDVGKETKTAIDLIREFGEIQKEEAEKIQRDIEDTANKRLNAIDMVSQAETQAFNIIAQLNFNKLIAIDNEEAKQLKALEATGLGEEELAKRKLAIQEKSDADRAIILTKQAKADKLAAIFQATINTATAVTKALITSTLFAIVVGALGAIEIAAIAAQPIPTFHEGKKSELKEGEMYAKILKTESVIPPDASKKYKGAIDSMIDKKFESYVFQEYMLPMMKQMGKTQSSNPYDDIHIWNNQKKQIKLMAENNSLTRTLIKSLDPGHHRRSWR